MKKYRSPLATPWFSPRRRPWFIRPRLTVELLEDRNLLDAGGLGGLLDLSGLVVDPNAFADNRVLVRILPGASPDVIHHQPGVTAAEALPLVEGLYSVSLAPNMSVEQALAMFQRNPMVVYAEPDRVIQLAKTPNDPSFTSLWAMDNTGQSGGKTDADIDATEAWEITTGSGSFVVGIIDTGIDYNHPDLAANIWTNAAEANGTTGFDDDGNGYVDDIHGYDFVNNDGDPMDDHSHGTHVAGTIGAVGDNGAGVAGVNWNVKMMGLKFLSASGSGSISNAIKALNYAVLMGVKVSNNSWGGGPFDQSMYNAIANARAAGHIFVAAAGNSGLNNDVWAAYPANYNLNNVVSVAATDHNDNLASFSNYGATTVDLAAPGASIYSTTPNNTYSSFSGTSMATPHVAGAIALVWGQNPGWTYTQVISAITANVDKLSNLTTKVSSGGRLNVAKALGATPLPPSDTIAPTIQSAVWSGASANTFNKITVTFSEAVTGFTSADVSLKRNGTTVSVSSVTAIDATNTKFAINFATQTAAATYTAVIGPNINDSAGNAMAAAFTTSAAITPLYQFNSTLPPMAIPDMGGVISPIFVGQNLFVGDINVQININHTWDSDLYVRLVAPNGQEILLSNRRGGSGNNFTNTIFDDEATKHVANGFAPFSGSFRPEMPLYFLDGINARGAWHLIVDDVAFADVGTLFSWKLTISPMAGTFGGEVGASFVAESNVPAAIGGPAVLSGVKVANADLADLSSGSVQFVSHRESSSPSQDREERQEARRSQATRLDAYFAKLADSGSPLEKATRSLEDLLQFGDQSDLLAIKF